MMKLYFYMHFPKDKRKWKTMLLQGRQMHVMNLWQANDEDRQRNVDLTVYIGNFSNHNDSKNVVDVDDNENANDDDDVQALLVVLFQLKFIKQIMMLCGGGWTCSWRWCSWCSPPYVALQLITFSLPWATSSSLLLFEVVVSFSFS